jgi:cyclopropane-fatty-acyl-phospholipid synthase
MFEKKGKKLLHDAGIQLGGEQAGDLVIYDSSVYKDTVFYGNLGLGDAYINKKWDCEDLDVFFYKILSARANSVGAFVDSLQSIRDFFINTQIGKRAFDVGQKHYDLGNEMYSLMLGESMGYSSGMYLNQDDDLTTAQYNKFEALCIKLQLEPGMKVLEIGAGWGTFARHAAEHYGVEVVGLTVSVEQKKFAEDRCSGLPVEFLLLDYQKLPSKYDNYFDRVVSIEMIEAVGKKNFITYFKTITRSLKDGGIVGIQAIVGSGEPDSFISTRIFPNGVLPSIKDIVNSTSNLLRIKHWESFGKDYDRTLMAWNRNFVENWIEIKDITDSKGNKIYDERFYRMWSYYLLCCAGSFRAGYIDVCQVVFSKENSLSVLK